MTKAPLPIYDVAPINRLPLNQVVSSLELNGVFPPSLSTYLLIRHMRIKEKETVLDLCAGSGIIGIMSAKLGAYPVFGEIDHRAKPVILSNLEHNQLHNIRGDRVAIGDLFEPFNGQKFDHILCNPPSIPCPTESGISTYINGGVNGRNIHNRIYPAVRCYLKGGGRLTFVQTSLADWRESMQQLDSAGLSIKVIQTIFIPLDNRQLPLEYIRQLQAKNPGKRLFFEIQGRIYEFRAVIEATLK